MRLWLGCIGGCLGLALWAGGCGDSSSDDDASATSNAGGAGAAGGDGGSGNTIANICDPPCDSGLFCSAIGECIEDGTCAVNEDCDEGLECDTGAAQCVPGGGCGAQEIALTPVPPNMMIVLDRSCSMRRDLDDVLNIAGPNKWTFSVDAINLMTTDYVDQIRFGLIMFPDTASPNCGQDVPAVAVGAGNESTIQTLLTAALDTNDANYPSGPCVTNIDTAMEQAATEPAFLDLDRQSYALLLTDGKQAGCNDAGGDNGTTQIITDLNAAGVATFVVGFGGSVDPAQLDIFAQAGGVPQTGMTAYYQADSAAQLDAALKDIATATLGCVFELEEAPPEEESLYVFIDNDPAGVDKDTSHMDGWDYDPSSNQVEFYGPLCESIKAGEVDDIDIVFGCPTSTPD